jgi:hypothetical protein
MKTLLTAALIFLLSVTTLGAQQHKPPVPKEAHQFYSKVIGDWNLEGVGPSENLNAACSMAIKWQDGSFFVLIFDLADGEVYALINYTKWKFKVKTETTHKAKFHSVKNKERVKTGNGEIHIMSTSGVSIRGLVPRVVFPNLRGMDALDIEIPKELGVGISIPMTEFEKSLEGIIECFKAFSVQDHIWEAPSNDRSKI